MTAQHIVYVGKRGSDEKRRVVYQRHNLIVQVVTFSPLGHLPLVSIICKQNLHYKLHCPLPTDNSICNPVHLERDGLGNYVPWCQFQFTSNPFLGFPRYGVLRSALRFSSSLQLAQGYSIWLSSWEAQWGIKLLISDSDNARDAPVLRAPGSHCSLLMT